MSTSFPSLAQAIANLEGYGKSGAIPTVANNPGDLELGDIGYGTLQASGGNQITVFPDSQSGWQALVNQVESIYSGNSKYYTPQQSLQEFGNIYSGGNSSYGSNLASQLGVSPSTTLGQLQQSSPSSQGGFLNRLKDMFSGNPTNGVNIPDMGFGSGGLGIAGGLIFSSRLIILIIGIILIAAGLYSFKTTQTVIEGATKVAKKGAEIAAA